MRPGGPGAQLQQRPSVTDHLADWTDWMFGLSTRVVGWVGLSTRVVGWIGLSAGVQLCRSGGVQLAGPGLGAD